MTVVDAARERQAKAAAARRPRPLKPFDDSARAWRLRDEYIPQVAAKIAEATTWGQYHQAIATALLYITHAARAGQSEHAIEWAKTLGEAQDAVDVSGLK